ncbi:AraC family transcriptional regulator [Streptomyces sp. NPDC035033]|uniref:helix-turn-helix transcriptional regulator n=1 Tax=Streptomyces sp. NPDC035033 TaxID=3155368 RepID=UPI0033F4C9A7
MSAPTRAETIAPELWNTSGGTLLLLDTVTLPPAERLEAFRHGMTNESVPNHIVHEEPPQGVHARMELWTVGDLPMFSTYNSGFQAHRTPAHIRRQRSNPVVSVSLQHRGTGRGEVAGQQMTFGPEDVCVFHELSPRVYGWSGDGGSQAMVFDVDRIGLPVETVVRASLQLRASPLHSLVLRHLRDMWRDPGLLAQDPGAMALASATTDLVRALLISAAHDPSMPVVRSVMDETLLTRVMAHVRRHHTDPGLSAESIAAAHGVSVRHLYQVLRDADMSLEQWIISERLDTARKMLASPDHAGLTIGAVAARCGFSSPSHFTRRFRSAYEVSPREWRRQRRQGTGAPSTG